MSWKNWIVAIVMIGVGTNLTDGFTGWLGGVMMSIGFGIACYHDGKKEGRRSLLIDKARFWWK